MLSVNNLVKPNSFFLIAGPCVVEEKNLTLEIAEKLKNICNSLGISFVFKASYKKANRTKIDSFTGIGDDKALEILNQVKNKLDIPVTTDIHSVNDINNIGTSIDIIQIPAFLSRQTDLLVEAAKTNKIINIKKGQFLSSETMMFAVQKIISNGNRNVLLTERGNTFGYKDLVVDFRNIPIMQQFAPVILDITHSLQQPNQTNGITGGNPALIQTIAQAGIAAGANGIFLETHPSPCKAKSDGENMLKLDLVEILLKKLVSIRNALT